MKANAPEKVYLKIDHPISDDYTEMIAFKDGDGVEYTRTDAFIEKLKDFLNKKDDRDSYTIGYIKRHLEEIIKEIGL